MAKKMKVLHLASFTGNIGDEANHNGFRRKLNLNLGINFEYTNLEIRNFYKSWDLMKFDDNFIDLCNQHDLVIIGGGNFLELCWDYSRTGTTIDLDIDSLSRIKSPVIFNAIGIDDGKGISYNNKEKFKVFLDYILDNERILFSVRNDGSRKILERHFSSSKLENVHVVPDGGFFVDSGNFQHIEVNKDRINIGINIAGDMKDIRFGEDYDIFCKRFGEYVNLTLSGNDRINVVFIPHMYSDIRIISQVIEYIKDDFRRMRISIAPLLNGTLNGGNYIFSLYKELDLMLGMRFHSNVCSIGQGIPNIGLITYPKHGYLFDEVNLSDRALYINSPNFFQDLLLKTKVDLEQLVEIRERYRLVNKRLNIEIDRFHNMIAVFLNKTK